MARWLGEAPLPTHTPFAREAASSHAAGSCFSKQTISAKAQMGVGSAVEGNLLAGGALKAPAAKPRSATFCPGGDG
eukprot:15452440-Alexandrium_andersonii.AAC.1